MGVINNSVQKFLKGAKVQPYDSESVHPTRSYYAKRKCIYIIFYAFAEVVADCKPDCPDVYQWYWLCSEWYLYVPSSAHVRSKDVRILTNGYVCVYISFTFIFLHKTQRWASMGSDGKKALQHQQTLNVCATYAVNNSWLEQDWQVTFKPPNLTSAIQRRTDGQRM